MKKGAFTLLNFLAVNVLLVAIYLNFIHKDVNTLPPVSASAHATVTSQAALRPKKEATVNYSQPQKGFAGKDQ